MPSSTSSLVMQSPDTPLIWIERLSAAASNQPQRLDLRRKALRHQKVAQADRAPRDLVFVGRPDAAAGGADFRGALRRFARDVDRRVIRKDQGTGLGDAQARRNLDAGALELVHLLDQRLRRKHHAVADVAGHALPEDARGDEVQHGLPAADHQRMPGVVPALEAHHPLGVVGKPVHDLALAFVTPLGAYDDDVLGHRFQLLSSLRTVHSPASLTSSRSQSGSTPSAACPGSPTTTTSPPVRSLRIAVTRPSSSEYGARMAAASASCGAVRARSRRSMLKPVAGRPRPNALPTSS